MVIIGGRKLESADFYNILFGGAKVELDKQALGVVEKSYLFLEEFASDKIIYGINTGLGPMAQYKVNRKDQVQLPDQQYLHYRPIDT